MPKKAILVVDIQNDFTGEKAKMPVDKSQAIQMIGNINLLLDKTSKTETEVIYIGNEYPKNDLFNIFRNFAAIERTVGAKPDPRLRVVSDIYFPKHRGNAFTNPALDAYLKAENISELFICGLFAEACIYATVKGALKNNYKVNVLTDCLASKSDRKRDRMIHQYEKLGVRNIASTSL